MKKSYDISYERGCIFEGTEKSILSHSIFQLNKRKK